MNNLDRYTQATQGQNSLQIIERNQPVTAPMQSLISPNLGRWISRWGICFAIGIAIPSLIAISPWAVQVTIIFLILLALGLVGGMVALDLKEAIPYCLCCLVAVGAIVLSWLLIFHRTLQVVPGGWS